MPDQEKLTKLEAVLRKLYRKHHKELLFHGWHHVVFVVRKAIIFAKSSRMDLFLVESAAWTHDLNYIVAPNSSQEAGEELRAEILKKCGYSQEQIARIEKIILEASIATRGKNISPEAQVLSDADTLFKTIPTTPILFASKFMTQNKIDLDKLAKRIIQEQEPLMEQGIYFYTKAAKKYLPWAKANLQIWSDLKESLKDKDVLEMLEIAKEMKVL